MGDPKTGLFGSTCFCKLDIVNNQYVINLVINNKVTIHFYEGHHK